MIEIVMEGHLQSYRESLSGEERSAATIEKYLRDAGAFFLWLPKAAELKKERVIAYKRFLLERYASTSVNSMLAAVNSFLRFLGRHDCVVKTVHIQRRLFRAKEKELSKQEYLRLLHAASAAGNRRLGLIMQCICSTGIRVSELAYITVSAARTGRAEVRCKGKTRTILLPHQLCGLLLRYAAAAGVRAGPVFVTRGGKPVDRSNIWSGMKALCKSAGVAQSKVFPHNLRHLFARTFYGLEKDLTRLADMLGHSSIETTRIYTTTDGCECELKLNQLDLLYSGQVVRRHTQS